MIDALPYKNRKGLLVFFGILTLLGGLYCLTYALAALAVSSFDFYIRIGGFLAYGTMSALFITLGIGSILAKRWARALLLIQSWITLIISIIVLSFLIFNAASLFDGLISSVQERSHTQQQTQEASGSVAQQPVLTDEQLRADYLGPAVGIIVFLGFLLIVLPAGWILVYSNRHVKATCEANNPSPCWTDACPLPVLAGSLMMIFLALTMLLSPFCFPGNTNMFFNLILAIIYAYTAWAFYRLKPLGWWIALSLVVFFGVSVYLSFRNSEAVNPSYQQITFFFQAAQIVYLFWIKRFFRRNKANS